MRPALLVSIIVAALAVVAVGLSGGDGSDGQGPGRPAAAASATSDSQTAGTVPGRMAPVATSSASDTRPARRLPGVLEPTMDARTALDLTTTVPADERVRVDDREKQVLGSREIGQGAAAEVVVFTRDVLSGQVERWQPALRWAARSGAHDALLSDYPELTRRFANPLYAEAAVAVTDIAAAHRRLAADPRVASVTLLPIEAPVRLH